MIKVWSTVCQMHRFKPKHQVQLGNSKGNYNPFGLVGQVGMSTSTGQDSPTHGVKKSP